MCRGEQIEEGTVIQILRVGRINSLIIPGVEFASFLNLDILIWQKKNFYATNTTAYSGVIIATANKIRR